MVRRDAGGLAASAPVDKGQRFVFSTDDETRGLDVVVQDWDRKRGEGLREYRGNPVVIDNGDHMRVVGRALAIEQRAGALEGRIGWDLDNPDPSLAAVGRQHLSGYRSAVEVVFRSGKQTRRSQLPSAHPHYRAPSKMQTAWGEIEVDGWLYEQNTLLALSSTTIPTNPAILGRSAIEARSVASLNRPPLRAPQTDRAARAFLSQLGSELEAERQGAELLSLVAAGLRRAR